MADLSPDPSSPASAPPQFPWLRALPATLVLFRLAAGPYLLWAAWDGQPGPSFVPVFGLAVLSDIFDGVLARRLNVVNAGLREADSRADLCLYLCIIACMWRAYPTVLAEFALPFALAVASQCLQWGTALAKYGRLASYHSYSAKLWGLSLAVAVVALFGWGYSDLTLGAALYIGVFHNLEEVAMTLILPRWCFDVVTVQAALVQRRALLAAPSTAP